MSFQILIMNFVLCMTIQDHFTKNTPLSMLQNIGIASKVNNIKNMKDIISKRINYKQSKKINKNLSNIGIEILKKNFAELNKYI